MKKDVVAGLGEIDLPMQKLLSRTVSVVGYDKKTELMNTQKLKKFENHETEILHICIPFTKNFISNILVLEKKFKPEIIAVHSTIRPTTTEKLQNKLSQPIIYSPLRGVHKRKNDKLQEHKKGISFDIKRYVKFYSIQPNVPKGNIAAQKFSNRLRKCGLKTKKISTPVTLELAKILCDTSYYGWLINYAQLSKMISVQYNVDYDEMWSFSEEIHKFLGNRPKMYPGVIGGHCVIPNLDLIENQSLHFIKKLNKKYSNKIKHSKTISKRSKAK